MDDLDKNVSLKASVKVADKLHKKSPKVKSDKELAKKKLKCKATKSEVKYKDKTAAAADKLKQSAPQPDKTSSSRGQLLKCRENISDNLNLGKRPPKDKVNVLHEEDIVDGFAILSFLTYEDLRRVSAGRCLLASRFAPHHINRQRETFRGKRVTRRRLAVSRAALVRAQVSATPA